LALLGNLQAWRRRQAFALLMIGGALDIPVSVVARWRDSWDIQ
jgi:hypothetical protein